VESLRAISPDASVTVRDLARTPHPSLDDTALQALFTPADQQTPLQTARVAQDDALIAEIKAADIVVLGVPMYNFGIPAQLKNWIDAVTRAKVTFRYTANGPEGLLKGKKVYVDVKDSGKGIPPGKFNTVFRPGYSTKKRGWGLGLSLAKRIIEEFHDGKIFVKESNVGKGTTFRIMLKA
jgi:nitrogen fixation/metabolism regulation signal transduction histidine kinase